ncbi:unnamed protein product [Prunus armeniaca]
MKGQIEKQGYFYLAHIMSCCLRLQILSHSFRTSRFGFQDYVLGPIPIEIYIAFYSYGLSVVNMGKKPSTKKSTSQNRCKGKGVVPTPVAQNKASKRNNNRSVVTSEWGSSSTAYHSNPAYHPLFGVRRYTHKNHNSSDPVLHVNVFDHLSYKNTLTHIKGCGNNTILCNFTWNKGKKRQTPPDGIGGAVVGHNTYIPSR